MHTKSGSTFVEAAFLFPFVILLVAGMIQLALTMHENAKENAIVHQEKIFSEYDSTHTDFTLRMRKKWVLQ